MFLRLNPEPPTLDQIRPWVCPHLSDQHQSHCWGNCESGRWGLVLPHEQASYYRAAHNLIKKDFASHFGWKCVYATEVTWTKFTLEWQIMLFNKAFLRVSLYIIPQPLHISPCLTFPCSPVKTTPLVISVKAVRMGSHQRSHPIVVICAVPVPAHYQSPPTSKYTAHPLAWGDWVVWFSGWVGQEKGQCVGAQIWLEFLPLCLPPASQSTVTRGGVWCAACANQAMLDTAVRGGCWGTTGHTALHCHVQNQITSTTTASFHATL